MLYLEEGLIDYQGRSKDGLYEPALADSEREAVADLLTYLENVRTYIPVQTSMTPSYRCFSGEKPTSSRESLFDPSVPWYTPKMSIYSVALA